MFGQWSKQYNILKTAHQWAFNFLHLLNNEISKNWYMCSQHLMNQQNMDLPLPLQETDWTVCPLGSPADTSCCLRRSVHTTPGQTGEAAAGHPGTTSGQIYCWPNSPWGQSSCGSTAACWCHPSCFEINRRWHIIKIHKKCRWSSNSFNYVFTWSNSSI